MRPVADCHSIILVFICIRRHHFLTFWCQLLTLNAMAILWKSSLILTIQYFLLALLVLERYEYLWMYYIMYKHTMDLIHKSNSK